MKYLWHCVLAAIKLSVFVLVVGGVKFKRRFFPAYSKEYNERIADMHSRYEDELRERDARRAQQLDPSLKKGSPHPPTER